MINVSISILKETISILIPSEENVYFVSLYFHMYNHKLL